LARVRWRKDEARRIACSGRRVLTCGQEMGDVSEWCECDWARDGCDV